MDALFAWLEHTSAAAAIASSTTLTGSLSAIHVIGFVLVMSGALVANVRSLRVRIAGRDGAGIATQANRLMLVGLAVSLLTGRSALFSGARQLLIGGAAVGVTYLVGTLIGVTVS